MCVRRFGIQSNLSLSDAFFSIDKLQTPNRNCKLPQMGEFMTFHLKPVKVQTVVYFWVEIHNFKLKFAICPFTI